MAYDTDLSVYPVKLLADGSVSRVGYLPGGEIGRVRTSPCGTTRFTLSVSTGLTNRKRNIVGHLTIGNLFCPKTTSDFILLKKLKRQRSASKGCQIRIL